MGDQAATLRAIAGGKSDGDIIPIGKARRRVIAVTGGKGGVGKSTVALNLALAFAQRGSRTLALDGDFGMADLNLLLGVAPTHSLLDILTGTPIDEVLIEAHGIHLLPALNGSYAMANLDQRGRDILYGALDTVARQFDTLVVDTAAGIGSNVIDLAANAGEVVVVATAEPLSMADAYACMKVLSQKGGVKRAFLLPNEVRSPSEADEIVSRLTALVDHFLDLQVTPLPPVPYDQRVPMAAAAGLPCLLHSPESPASRAIRRAAQRIDSLCMPEQVNDRAIAFGGWL